MKHNLIKKSLLLIILIAGVMFINTDVFALSCAESEIDSILDHFKVKSSYDISSKTVTISVKNGTFITTHVEDGGIISENAPVKNTMTYEGVSFDYYSFGSTNVVSKNNPIKFKVKSGGVIKIGLAFYKENDKTTKDSSTGCYSYDYWKKNGGSNSSIRTFETKKVEDGKTQYIEIDVPNPATAELKTNTNKDTYCKAIREGVNYNNKFDKTVMSYWDSKPEAIEFYKKMIGDCWNDQVVYVYKENDIIKIIESAIKLWHNNAYDYDTGLGPDEAWSINFENVMKAAIEAGHAYYAEDNPSGSTFYTLVNGSSKGTKISNTTFDLQCKFSGNNLDYRTYDSEGHVLYKDGKLVYNIDANIHSFYALTEKDQYVTYTYNYSGSANFVNRVTEEVKVCTTTCEEAVEVKYGPPVASKAGLCFEYQVQVTSRVKCNSKVNPDGKPRDNDFCSPVPYCNRVPGYVHQGGAVEDYDSCISECDGGKYTKSCSNKCYKQVYGTITGASKMAIETIAYDTLEKLSASGSESFMQVDNGVYIRDRSNNIYWRKNKAGANAVGYARYYLEGSERTRTARDHGSYTFDYNGFKRARYGDTLCHDACYYTGCGIKSYLNPGEMEADYAKNIEIYNDAIANCKAAASCTEKTATFTISTQYKEIVDGKTVTKTVDYNDSTLVSDDDSSCSNPTVPAKDNILLNYQGCYKNCGDGQQYHARWSFPGTWFNIKTGEISYRSKPSEAWYEESDKFCTPRFAQNVNESWWNYYLHNNERMLKSFSIDPDTYSSQCASGHGTIKNPLSVDDIKPEWNIFASTKNFGYFGWNFDIKCFYALNECGSATYNNFRIRSTDNSNMFPNSSGSQLTDYAETGRDAGFNWSEEATTVKNPDYIINPPAYIANVQRQSSSGTSIYTDQNLDYEFDLSSSDIRELRKTKNFTDYAEGSFMRPGTGGNDAQNGVARYYSNVITNYATRRPGKKAVQCNNIKDSSNNSGECDNYNAG